MLNSLKNDKSLKIINFHTESRKYYGSMAVSRKKVILQCSSFEQGQCAATKRYMIILQFCSEGIRKMSKASRVKFHLEEGYAFSELYFHNLVPAEGTLIFIY